MIKLVVGVAIIAAQNQNSPAPCVTRQQVSDIVVALTPFIIDGAREGCRPHLDPAAYLMRPEAQEFAARARTETEARGDAAAEAFRLIAGDRRELRGIRTSTLVNVMGEVMTNEFVGSMNSDKCSSFNALIESLAPLSASQAGTLLASFFALARFSRGSRRGPSICAE